jgi:hypothetical protein
MTREEIEKKKVELARKYLRTRNTEIAVKIYRLSRELEKMEKVKKK